MSTNRAAKAVLDKMWDGSLPVPIDRLVSSIRIASPSGYGDRFPGLRPVELRIEADQSLSGSCEFDAEKGHYVITVSPSNNRLRRRFTIAHELGHILQKHLDGCDRMYRADDASSFYSTMNDPQEVAANRFAAELLMPKTAVEHFALNTDHSIEQIAATFQVSTVAMKYRLKNLGLI